MRTFAIVGLGLIGGSLGAALRKRFPRASVVGVSRDQRKINLARRKGLIYNGTRDYTRGFQYADMIFVCTPVDTIPTIVSKIDRVARPGTIVTDVGSTKGEITRWADRQHFKNIKFVGSHPLAGSHLKGAEHARQGLFRDAFVFVTPTKGTNTKARSGVVSVWKKLGAKVKVVNPKTHDVIASEVSHLPHAVATCLIQSVSNRSLKFASTGFRDTTRIAQGDPKLWAPIFLSNRKNLIRDLKQCNRHLTHLISGLERSSKTSIESTLRRASRARSQA
jgi:cyclohexadieny/prephenate dehydrogenase